MSEESIPLFNAIVVSNLELRQLKDKAKRLDAVVDLLEKHIEAANAIISLNISQGVHDLAETNRLTCERVLQVAKEEINE